MRIVPLISILLCIGMADTGHAALVPPTHPLFDGDAVHEIHLTFEQADWWDRLEYNFESYEDPPLLAAAFDWEAVHFDSIGVRFKGNSSYNHVQGYKKSFKLDLDEFSSSQELEGLDKLNLNNVFMDPSFVRERAGYEICDALGLPACRSNYAALYINGDYWGLYVLLEQVDQEYIESRFGGDENGNLWKGEPKGTFEYFGTSVATYKTKYELKTNEDVDDWSDLIEAIDLLNNTPTAYLPDSLHNVMDVGSALMMHAADILTVNLDSYIGRCANYYFYHRDLDDRLVFLKWDLNMCWGTFNLNFNYSITEREQLDALWTNPRYGEARPLEERLWEVPVYTDIYLGHLRRLMAGAAEPDRLIARMEEMRDLIRPWVYSDPNKFYSNTQFENAMDHDTPSGPNSLPALGTFIRNRDTYLRSEIGEWTPIPGLVLNEIMAANATTIPDNMGEYEDWVEILNTGDAAIELGGLGLTDHHDGGTHFIFPTYSLTPGARVIVWCDEEIGEGDWHAPFKLDRDGEDLYLLDDVTVVDQMSYPALAADQSWGRWPDGTGDWQLLSLATPGTSNDNSTNPEEVTLYINEFLASNASCGQDETGAYPDWVEIYNPGPAAVEMGGLFLSDDLSASTQWALPDTLLAAGGFMIIWCDEDEDDGPLHANFKLGAGGEEIALFGRLAAGNDLIDSYTFGPQVTDISEGRQTDGGASWILFDPPTPGISNNATAIDDTPASSPMSLINYPNPFNPTTRIAFTIPDAGEAYLGIFDLRGRKLATLINGELTAGHHYHDWNGRDDRDQPLASGVYFARLSCGAEQRRIRMVLLR
ncbi:MAG: hypothetical protein GY835_07520 [bacterium]|nr:hypothetical protein [bacterium]